MKESKYSLDILRKTFNDISKGYSVGLLNGEKVYVKHFTSEEQIIIEEKKIEFFNYAKKIGLPVYDDVLKRLISEDVWGQDKEKTLENQKKTVDNLTSSKKNSVTPSQAEFFQNKIDELNKKISLSEFQKRALIGKTCETYRDNESGKLFITSSLYGDNTFNCPIFKTKRDIEELDDFEPINDLYESCTKHLSQDHILHLVVHPVFLQYFYLLGDDVCNFFGKPICSLTFLQVELLHSALKYRNIFREIGQIPDEIDLDPYKISEYADNAKNMEKILDNRSGSDGAMKSVVGANQKDLDKMGVKSINKMMREKAMQNGGSLDKKQLASFLNKK